MSQLLSGNVIKDDTDVFYEHEYEPELITVVNDKLQVMSDWFSNNDKHSLKS